MQSRKIKVGFDFDGVLFYNPTRLLRPFTSWIQRTLLGRKETHFYIPQHPFLKKIGSYLHKTSFRPNIGFKHFIDLVKDPRYEIYIITARLSFVKENLHKLLAKHGVKVENIHTIYQNIHDEQPHIYKERLLKQLNLDHFVEDNWDIVKHLTKTTKTRVIWIYNLIDKQFIHHQPRVPNIGEAIKKILSG